MNFFFFFKKSNSADETLLLSGSADKELRVWKINTELLGKQLENLGNTEEEVRFFIFFFFSF